MTDRTMLETRWDEMKGRIKEAWGAVSDDDLTRLEGRWEQLVATIRQKSGETVEAVESKLDEMIDSLDREVTSTSS